MGKAINDPAGLLDKPGYYFNSKLVKLARLHEGDKLPPSAGIWEHIADLHEMTSSQVVRKLLDMKPGIDPQHLSYTVHGSLDRRLPGAEAKASRWGRTVLLAVLFIGIGVFVSRRAAVQAFR